MKLFYNVIIRNLLIKFYKLLNKNYILICKNFNYNKCSIFKFDVRKISFSKS